MKAKIQQEENRIEREREGDTKPQLFGEPDKMQIQFFRLCKVGCIVRHFTKKLISTAERWGETRNTQRKRERKSTH